jgi:hypothetical protein
MCALGLKSFNFIIQKIFFGTNFKDATFDKGTAGGFLYNLLNKVSINFNQSKLVKN